MGTHFQPTGNAGQALRGAQIGAARAANAPQYVARGQGIAAQKYVDAANKLNAFKPKKPGNGSSVYPPGYKEI